MSRIGKLPVAIPSGVTVDHREPLLTVRGPKGELTLDVHPAMTVHVGRKGSRPWEGPRTAGYTVPFTVSRVR